MDGGEHAGKEGIKDRRQRRRAESRPNKCRNGSIVRRLSILFRAFCKRGLEVYENLCEGQMYTTAILHKKQNPRSTLQSLSIQASIQATDPAAPLPGDFVRLASWKRVSQRESIMLADWAIDLVERCAVIHPIEHTSAMHQEPSFPLPLQKKKRR